jgi:hypothetical protein
VSKLKGWLREYRFLVMLAAVLIVLAFILTVLTRSPDSTWEDTWRALGQNLAAELLGAVISIVVIGWFLKRHEEQRLQHVRVSASRRIHSLGYRTIVDCIGVIPRPEQDDPIDASAFVELVERIAVRDFTSASAKLSDVFRQPPSMKHPETFRRTQEVASDLQSEWADLLDMLQQYLTPDQCAGTLRIIELLESLALRCRAVLHLLDVQLQGMTDGEIARMRLGFQVAASVTELGEEVLGLLQLCFQ